MSTWYLYAVTREPGPRSAGEQPHEYADAAPYPLPVQECNRIGDTLYRRFLRTVDAPSYHHAVVIGIEELYPAEDSR